MFDQAIINRWIEERSTIALQKLLHNEPLTFEDNIIFALVGGREEITVFERKTQERFEQVDRRFEQVDRRFEQVDRRLDRVESMISELRKEMGDLRREMGDLRKEMGDIRKDLLTYTRWTLTVIIAVPVVTKLLEALLSKLF
jgi:septal ring factor EnvC (AmiA/AmiB activator)